MSLCRIVLYNFDVAEFNFLSSYLYEILYEISQILLVNLVEEAISIKCIYSVCKHHMCINNGCNLDVQIFVALVDDRQAKVGTKFWQI